MKRALGLALIILALPSSAAAITYPDFSNNDPCYCARELKAHGHAGLIAKVNQGVGFIDRTFKGMVTDAKAHGLITGGYDFDQDYTAAETYTFIAGLKAAGINPGTARTFPPTLDVEFGLASRAGLEHQLAIVKRVYGRAQIYTGPWYWLPHFGCWIPPGVTFWLSGYPSLTPFCGLNGNPLRVNAHQFTNHGSTGARQVPYADVTRYLGHDFPGFTHARAKPSRAQLKAAKTASLRVHESEREALHGNIERHHCRKGQHVIPRNPLRTRRHLHNELCPRWIKRSNEVIAVIDRYHREGIR